jgi:hypothetical protein
VYERHVGSGLYLLGQEVHGVGANQHALCACGFQLPGRLAQDDGHPIPIPCALSLSNVCKVQTDQIQFGAAQATQTLGDLAVDDLVVQGGRFPAHAADQSYGFHECVQSVAKGSSLMGWAENQLAFYSFISSKYRNNF